MAKHHQIVPEIACAEDLRDCRKPQIRIPEIPDEPKLRRGGTLAVRCRSHVAACASQAECPWGRSRPPTAGEAPAATPLLGHSHFCTGLLTLILFTSES